MSIFMIRVSRTAWERNQRTGADGETRTLTCSVLSAVPLPLGYVGFCLRTSPFRHDNSSREHTKDRTYSFPDLRGIVSS